MLAVGRFVAGLPDLLLTFVERFTVIAMAAFMFYLTSGLVFSRNPPVETRAAQILEILNQNWRVLLILAIPLFYRPVKRFLDELEEAFGMKRQRPPPVQRQPQPHRQESDGSPPRTDQ